MKTVLVTIILSSSALFSGTIFAEVCEEKKPNFTKCVEEAPKPKIVVKTVEKQVPAPCCEKGDVDANAAAKTAVKASTGSQTVNITLPTQTRTKVKVRTKKVVKEVEVTNPNRLLLLVGVSKTDVELEEKGCCNFRAVQHFEPDVGLQYSRDFGSFTGAVGGTIQQNIHLGLGFNW
jgi:hypothetical protein